MKLLWIEDDSDEQEIIQRTVPGISITFFGSILEARAAGGTAQYDAAFVDLDLRDSIGVSTVALFRDRMGDMPLVVCSNAEDPETLAECLSIGAHEILQKSAISDETIRLAARLAIERRRSARAEAVVEGALREEELVQARAEMQRQILLTLGHELNTPMTPILLRLRLLQKGLDDEHAAHAKALAQAIGRLRHITDKALASAQSLGGHISVNVQCLSIGKLISEAIEQRVFSGDTAPLDPADIESAEVLADETRTYQVLSELMDNALRHGDGGMSMRGRIAENAYKLEISNPGSLPESVRSRLFQPFATSGIQEQEVQTRSGIGMGLYIAYTRLRAQGGSIELVSHDPVKFVLQWPLAGQHVGKESNTMQLN